MLKWPVLRIGRFSASSKTHPAHVGGVHGPSEDTPYSGPSIASRAARSVRPFPSARRGSLASFEARAYPGTKKWYGTSGNSFVAVVEFGKTVRAKAVTAGGESGDPASLHFNDQAKPYSTGELRDVYYYRWQLQGHTQREYHPGN